MSTKRLGTERRNRFRRMILCGRPWVECHYCGQRLTLLEVTLDHVVPLSNGGAKGIRNIVPACVNCNRRKADRSYHSFVRVVAMT